jgi:hypothetical protein
MVRSRGARVIFACPAKLLAMLAGAADLDRLIGVDSAELYELSDVLVASVADLPRLLESNVAPAPFRIAVPAQRTAAWSERLAALGPPPYLGLTWRAGTGRQATSEFAPAGLAALYKEIDIAALARAVRDWPGSSPCSGSRNQGKSPRCRAPPGANCMTFPA